jgi:glutaconate CoA-transferase subunit A
MSLRFLAGGLGLPFIPATSGFRTDIVRIDGFSKTERGQGKVPLHKLVVQEDPFHPGQETILLPALNPDVAILHAQYVGEDCTVRMKGLTFADLEQVRSAHHVIVSCERIVSEEFMRNDPDQNCLAGFMVDAIVPVPFGAHPTACFGFYDYDPIHLKLYAKAASQDHTFQEYLDEWVRTISSQQDYIEKLGELHLSSIAADPVLGYAPGLDRR